MRDVVGHPAFQFAVKEHPIGTPSARVHNTQWSPCGQQGSPSSSCFRVLFFILVLQVLECNLVLVVHTGVPLLLGTQENNQPCGRVHMFAMCVLSLVSSGRKTKQ